MAVSRAWARLRGRQPGLHGTRSSRERVCELSHRLRASLALGGAEGSPSQPEPSSHRAAGACPRRGRAPPSGLSGRLSPCGAAAAGGHGPMSRPLAGLKPAWLSGKGAGPAQGRASDGFDLLDDIPDLSTATPGMARALACSLQAGAARRPAPSPAAQALAQVRPRTCHPMSTLWPSRAWQPSGLQEQRGLPSQEAGARRLLQHSLHQAQQQQLCTQVQGRCCSPRSRGPRPPASGLAEQPSPASKHSQRQEHRLESRHGRKHRCRPVVLPQGRSRCSA